MEDHYVEGSIPDVEAEEQQAVALVAEAQHEPADVVNEAPITCERSSSHSVASTRDYASKYVPKKSTRNTRENSTARWLASRAPRSEMGAPCSRRPGQARRNSMVTPKHLLHGNNYSVSAVCFSQDGQFIATASKDVRLYDQQSGKLRAALDGHAGLVRCVTFTPDSRILCSGSDDCAILVWSIEVVGSHLQPGHVVTLTPPGFPSSTNPIGTQFNPGSAQGPGSTGLAGSIGGAASASATNTPRSVACSSATAHMHTSHSGNASSFRVVQKVLKRHHKPVLSMATTPDSKYLVSGSADKTVRVWDVGSGYCMATLRGHFGDVCSVAVTPNGRTILSGGTDRLILCWDFATGECTRTLKGHKGAVSCISVAPDGQWMVSAGFDRALRVWDLGNGSELAVLPAHGGAFGVLSCAISPDGCTIASGGYDRLVKVWDANSGLPLATLDAHRHMVSCVAFSKDSRMLATAGRDDDVRVWSCSPASIADSSNSSSYGAHVDPAAATVRRPHTAPAARRR